MADVIATSHGGDGGHEPPHGPARRIGTSCERSSSRAPRPKPTKPGSKIGKDGKVVRGPSQNAALIAMRNDTGRPVSIRYRRNAKGMWEHVGPHAAWYSSFVGTLIRDTVPLYHESWDDVSKASKAHVGTQLNHFFDLAPHLAGPDGEHIETSIEAYLRKVYNDQKYKLKKKYFTDEGGLDNLDGIRAKRPENMAEDQWEKQIQHWIDPGKLKIAKINSENRKKMKTTTLHGSHSLAVIADNFLSSSDPDSEDTRDHIDMYRHTHTTRDGAWESEEAESRYNRMVQLRSESTSSGTRMTDTDIMSQVIGGKQRGHIPGIGPVLPGGGHRPTVSASRAREEASSSTLNETVARQGDALQMILEWMRRQPGVPQELSVLAGTLGSQTPTPGESRPAGEGSGGAGGSGGNGDGGENGD